MAYSYRLLYSSDAAGETHTATVYGDDGNALASQPAGNIRDLGSGLYLYVTAAMPDSQGGAVKILNGATLVSGGVVSPPETEGVVSSLVTAALNSIADAFLKRDWTAVTGEASRSVLNALRVLRNKVSRSGATATVTKEDDSTTAWTAALTAEVGAAPVTSIDPS